MGRPLLVIAGRRNCTKCGRWRPVSDFSVNRRWPDGTVRWLNSYCWACEQRRARESARDPWWRMRKAENARILRRLRAEAEGRTVAAYKVVNPFTGNRVRLESLERYLKGLV